MLSTEAIHTAYPDADVQRCIVHQIRNFLAQMAWKDRKAVADGLRSVYTAPMEEAALAALASFEEDGERNILKSALPGGGIGRNCLHFSDIRKKSGA